LNLPIGGKQKSTTVRADEMLPSALRRERWLQLLFSISLRALSDWFRPMLWVLILDPSLLIFVVTM